MERENCKFKTGSKKVLPADSAVALSPPAPDPYHYRHWRPLDIQLTLAGHSTAYLLNREHSVFCLFSVVRPSEGLFITCIFLEMKLWIFDSIPIWSCEAINVE